MLLWKSTIVWRNWRNWPSHTNSAAFRFLRQSWRSSQQLYLLDYLYWYFGDCFSFHRPNGLRLWVPALKKIYIRFPAGNSISAACGRKDPFILFLYMCPSSVSQFIPSMPSRQRLFYMTGKNPRLALGHRALIQFLQVWKLYLNFVTQEDTQRKIPLSVCCN